MSGNQGYVQARRGLFEHVQSGRMSLREWAVFHLLLYLANSATGVWHGSSLALMSHFGNGDMTHRQAKDVLSSLEVKGYIKRFRTQGQRGNYAILVNKYVVTSGVLSGKWANAARTVSYSDIQYDARTETVCEAVPETVPEAVPYNNKEKETEKEDVATFNGGVRDERLPENSSTSVIGTRVEVSTSGIPSLVPGSTSSVLVSKLSELLERTQTDWKVNLTGIDQEALAQALDTLFRFPDNWWTIKIQGADLPVAFVAKCSDKILQAAEDALKLQERVEQSRKNKLASVPAWKRFTADPYAKRNPSFKPGEVSDEDEDSGEVFQAVPSDEDDV